MVTRSRPDAPSAVRALGSQRARVTGGGGGGPTGKAHACTRSLPPAGVCAVRTAAPGLQGGPGVSIAPSVTPSTLSSYFLLPHPVF